MEGGPRVNDPEGDGLCAESPVEPPHEPLEPVPGKKRGRWKDGNKCPGLEYVKEMTDENDLQGGGVGVVMSRHR